MNIESNFSLEEKEMSPIKDIQFCVFNEVIDIAICDEIVGTTA